METKNIRNICLMGHGNSGKTSLAESMLFVTGAIDRMGKVSDGNTVCDYDPEEIKRQITISTSVAPVNYAGCKINVLDCPGYFDFAGDVLSAIRAVECGVILCSAKDGISVGAERSWKYLKAANVPAAFCISKCDEEHGDYYAVLDALKAKYGSIVCAVTVPMSDGTGVIDVVHNVAYQTKGGKTAKVAIPAALQTQAAALAAQGKTPLFFGGAHRLLGVIAVADTIKEDSPQAIRELRNMGIRVVMLTGDNQRTAEAIGRQAGVDEVIAGVLPEGKEAVIRQLQKYGKVAMVGDGINDAPALTRADTGIAIGAGTDVAIDAADVVLMNSKLSDVPAAIRLSRAALRNIHENLFWAFIYNIIGIPLAAGVFIPLGLTLNPMFGAAAMSLSSFCVVSNALRLNLFDLHSAKRDHPPKHVPALPAALVQPAAEEDTIKEETAMKKTLTVEGMMCPHCEARVKKALEALPQVDEAVVSHEAGTAIVTLNAEVDDEVLKKAVEAQDYPVTGIQ